MSKKKLTKPIAAVSLGSIPMPPVPGAPAPPGAFEEVDRDEARRLKKPAAAQLTAAAGAAAEVRGSPAWTADFGARAPDPDVFARELLLADAWSSEAAATERWLVYVHAQRDRAWDKALATSARLKPKFDDAAKDDATIATRYPQLAAYLGARAEIAAKGVATRAAVKKKNAKATAKVGSP